MNALILLLYNQRNVGILEKIVQSLNVSSSGSSSNRASKETIDQYEAQSHVLAQLEEKVKAMLLRVQQPAAGAPPRNSSSSSAANHTSVVKLQRDFQRVQLRASQLQEAAVKKISLIQANLANNASSSSSAAAYSGGLPFGVGGGDPSLSLLGGGGDDGDAILAEHHRLAQMQLQEDRLHEEIMREREEEIRNINKGMHTVNEIYKDLAHIVGQQQEHVDQIETQMEDSRANAESGLKQVEKANENYGNSQCSVM